MFLGLPLVDENRADMIFAAFSAAAVGSSVVWCWVESEWLNPESSLVPAQLWTGLDLVPRRRWVITGQIPQMIIKQNIYICTYNINRYLAVTIIYSFCVHSS